ncbi:MAG: glycyl-radical enzyme activating protein [Candidatus Magnetomorum sp.]|nr:glycyl-radical enzyme activating protein [Candidatus Magnetomorum sp.]
MNIKNRKFNILDIKGNSLDDGPGIRTVIFFKGCPLSCVWCHNPESKTVDTQLSYDPKECIACDDCINSCSQGALSRENPFFIDRYLCRQCFECVNICPSSALSRVGRPMGINDIVFEIEKDLPFFQTSNGGVTFSGGEPTVYMDFLSQLIQICKSKGIHTLLETCGYFHWETFQAKILSHIDMIYYDIKIFDSKAHLKYCGQENLLILNNFIKLNKRIKDTNIRLLPRTPLIPGITATSENITAIATFLSENNITQAQLLEYNPLWLDKNYKIGVSNPYVQKIEMAQWMRQDEINKFKLIFEQSGIKGAIQCLRS